MMSLRSVLRASEKFISFRSMSSNVRISASPRVALNDVVPRIAVQGLSPKVPITLRAEMIDDKGKQLMSHAHFLSSEEGTVDVMTTPSVGGCYQGIFPSGLISTLKAFGEARYKYGRIVHDDIYQPLQIKVCVYEGHQPVDTSDSSMDHLTLERHLIAPGVKRIQVKNGRVRGVLYLPAGDKISPGVIEMYGAMGILVDKRSALLASRGIASLSLAYFNYDDISFEKIVNLDLEYFEEAVEFLTGHSQIISDRCGVVANCYGGVLGHAMAINIDKVKALYGINFGQRFFGHFLKDKKPIYYKDDLPYLSESERCIAYKEGSKKITFPSESFISDLTKVKGSFIEELHKVSKDKFFSYVFGEDDTYPFMKSVPAIKEAVGKDFDSNFSVKTFANAGHIIDPPYIPVVDSSFLRLFSSSSDTFYKTFIHYWGGTPQGNVNMQKEVWSDMQSFINLHIRDNSSLYQNWLLNEEKEQCINSKL